MLAERNNRTVLAASLVVVAGVLVYLNSFSGAFLFDDEYTILANPHIKRLWPLREAFLAPLKSPVRDRPVINLTLSLNYAVGGLNAAAYHWGNLAIHLSASLFLLGILRRTFLNRRLPPRYHSAALGLALSVTTLWTVHPLQTESVTYITQRCESLMGLFYLGALYSVIRGASSPRKFRWYGSAILLSALGMGAKATMVTVPLVVLMYDRMFLAASWKDLFRKRRWLYAGLTATWLILAALLLSTSYRDIKSHGVLEYSLSQFGVISHYLGLVFRPHPLCLDYGWPVARRVGEVFPPVLLVGGLLGLTVWALKKKSPPAFLGVWFFLILAPTSSILPLEDPAFEHRMYLPLAAVLVLVVAGGFELLNRLFPRHKAGRRIWGVVLVSLWAVLLSLFTVRRNRDYYTPVTMWRATVATRPLNDRAYTHLGNALLKEGRIAEAIEGYLAALKLSPDCYTARYNLGNVMAGLGKVEEAVSCYNRALEINPEAVESYNNLGALLAREGRSDEAIECFNTALRIDPRDPAAHYNLGLTLSRLGETSEADKCFRKVLELKPDYEPAREALRSIRRSRTVTPLPRSKQGEQRSEDRGREAGSGEQ